MTWAQLRFNLLQLPPGSIVPTMDLIDAWLNTRYEQVLNASDWAGIRARATIETTAAIQSSTDSVTLTVGSASVVGASTTWGAGIVGMKFYKTGDTAVYTVTARADTTHLTLDRPYEGIGSEAVGTVYAGAPYVLMQDTYPLPGDAKAVESILDAVTGYPLAEFTPDQLDQSAGPRILIDNPDVFAVIEDTAEVLGVTPFHQVQLYPPPRFARGYTVEYLRHTFKFNGTNPTQSPLPFVSDAVILYGVRADIAVWQGKMAQAQGFEAKFQEELRRLQLLDASQRKAKPRVQMASRFTRHRTGRAMRSFMNKWGEGAGGPN